MYKRTQCSDPYGVEGRYVMWPGTVELLNRMKNKTGSSKVQMIDWVVRKLYEEFESQKKPEGFFDEYKCTRKIANEPPKKRQRKR